MQKPLNILIEEEVKDTLQEMADEDHRSLTQFVRLQLTKDAEEWRAKNAGSKN